MGGRVVLEGVMKVEYKCLYMRFGFGCKYFTNDLIYMKIFISEGLCAVVRLGLGMGECGNGGGRLLLYVTSSAAGLRLLALFSALKYSANNQK